jgi:hypothetical protein
MSMQQSPMGPGRIALMTGGLVVLTLGVFAGADLLTRNAGSADRPAVASSTVPELAAPSAPVVTPSRNPRRQPDVDRGTPLDRGVFVLVAKDWRLTSPDPYLGIEVTSDGRGKAAFYLSTHPVESASVLPMDASAFAEGEGLHGVRVGAVQRLPVPNPNLSEAARVGFTGRRTIDGITYSVVGDCSRLRGAPSVNDVSVSICFMAYVPEDAAVRTEVRRMTASVAQSI